MTPTLLPRTSRLTRPALAALVLLLTGCSGSTPSAQDPTPTLTPTASPTSPAPVATTPAPVVTTTAPTSAAPSPVATRVKPARDGDVDGDGKADVVTTTATLLTVRLSGSGRSVTAPVNADAPRSAPVLGSTDVDRDGYAEVFLETAQGASTQFATPYRFDGKTLRELQFDGGPLRLGIGGSVTHGDGFRCTPAGLLEIRSAESADGLDFTLRVDTYRLVGAELEVVTTRTATGKQGDPEVEASYTVDCGAVGEGG